MKTATKRKLMTADEFFEWANRPENEDRSYELDEGKVVEMSRPFKAHGMVCVYVAILLNDFIRKVGRGTILSNDTGLLVSKRPDTLRGPDLMFFAETHSLDDAGNSYVKEVPELVVEILSPGDRPGKTMRRVNQYLSRGIGLVWLVDPEDRTVAIHRPGELPKLLDETDTVTGNGVLPGFKSPVTDFFQMPGIKPN